MERMSSGNSSPRKEVIVQMVPRKLYNKAISQNRSHHNRFIRQFRKIKQHINEGNTDMRELMSSLQVDH